MLTHANGDAAACATDRAGLKCRPVPESIATNHKTRTTINELHLQMASLYETSPLLVGLFDADDMLRYANPAFRRTLGLQADQYVTWSDLMRFNHAHKVGTNIETADFEAWLASARSRRGKLPFRGFETDIVGGKWVYMTETVGTNGWMLCVAFDVTAVRAGARSLRVAHDMAVRMAQTDGLTGISNRNHILKYLNQQLEDLRSHRQPCGMAVVDLDHFKQVNDTYGHQAGDLVLRNFAAATVKHLRRVDGFGRLGGEEFLILMPGIDEDSLISRISAVLSAVRQQRPLPEHPDFAYTASVGVGMLRATEDAATNLSRIDAALYRAKSSGRDQCATAD